MVLAMPKGERTQGRRRANTADAPPMVRWLKTIRSINGLDQEGLAQYIGKSRSAVAMYETAKQPIPEDVISTILATFPDSPLPPAGNEVQKIGQVLSAEATYTILYAGVVPASNWGDPLNGDEKVPVDPKFAGRNRFMCKVSGDSCWPALHQGDLTVWEADRHPPEGCIVLAERASDQSCTVKQLVRSNGRFLLSPVNPEFPLPEDGDGWFVTARLVGVIRVSDGPEKTWYWPHGLKPQHLC